MTMFSHIKAFLGYTATSKECLEYHEALYLDLDHTNYIEVSETCHFLFYFEWDYFILSGN